MNTCGTSLSPWSEETASPRMPRTVEAIEKLSWRDMQMIFAAYFATEIAAVTEDGGGALLRERVAGPEEDQQRALREAVRSQSG